MKGLCCEAVVAFILLEPGNVPLCTLAPGEVGTHCILSVSHKNSTWTKAIELEQLPRTFSLGIEPQERIWLWKSRAATGARLSCCAKVRALHKGEKESGERQERSIWGRGEHKVILPLGHSEAEGSVWFGEGLLVLLQQRAGIECYQG